MAMCNMCFFRLMACTHHGCVWFFCWIGIGEHVVQPTELGGAKDPRSICFCFLRRTHVGFVDSLARCGVWSRSEGDVPSRTGLRVETGREETGRGCGAATLSHSHRTLHIRLFFFLLFLPQPPIYVRLVWIPSCCTCLFCGWRLVRGAQKRGLPINITCSRSLDSLPFSQLRPALPPQPRGCLAHAESLWGMGHGGTGSCGAGGSGPLGTWAADVNKA